MVQLRYYTDCDEPTRARVLAWVHTEEFVSRIGMPECQLQHAPGAETSRGRIHNWVIFAGEQPVGLISAKVQDQPSNLLHQEPDDPADYPLLGTVTYIDPPHRGRRYASAAKHAISEHAAAAGVRTFSCAVAEDNPESLKSIRRAGYEYVRTDEVDGKLRFRRVATAPPAERESPAATDGDRRGGRPDS